MRATLSLCLVLSVSAAALAQIEMTERWSQVNASYICGYGPDVYSGGGNDSDGNLFAIDGVTLSGSGTEEDEYLGHHWTAGFTWYVAHEYAIDGGLNNVMQISASGATTTNSVVSGFASGTLSSTNPGNLLELAFLVGADMDFWFRGHLGQSGPLNRNNSQVIIYRWFDATGYQPYVVRSIQNANFIDLISLPAGSYRISAQAVSHASQNESAGASWDYELERVPEPATLSLIALAGATLLRRRGNG